MAFKDESWNDPPYDAKYGVKIKMVNGAARHRWYRTRSARNSAYNNAKKRAANPNFNEVDVSKVERNL